MGRIGNIINRKGKQDAKRAINAKNAARGMAWFSQRKSMFSMEE